MPAHLVPVNLSAAGAHAAAGLGSDVALPDPPTADQLDNWAQEAYSLNVSAAASFGFPIDNLTANLRQQALMFGVSRWRDVSSGGNTYRFGVALRVLIVVSDIQGSDALTLPVVAAKVEIDGARATAHMLVRGYHGSQLAAALPSWQSFGVDSYAEYMKAVSNIQNMILQDEGGIEPELLATTVLSPALPSPAVAAGSVYALHAIADRLTLARAFEHLANHDSEVMATVRAVYRSRLGEDELAVPTDDQQQDAKEQLYGLHVGHRIAW